MRARMSATKSPFGSMTTSPSPVAISRYATWASSVDLPTPVGPRTWVCIEPVSWADGDGTPGRGMGSLAQDPALRRDHGRDWQATRANTGDAGIVRISKRPTQQPNEFADIERRREPSWRYRRFDRPRIGTTHLEVGAGCSAVRRPPIAVRSTPFATVASEMFVATRTTTRNPSAPTSGLQVPAVAGFERCEAVPEGLTDCPAVLGNPTESLGTCKGASRGPSCHCAMAVPSSGERPDDRPGHLYRVVASQRTLTRPESKFDPAKKRTGTAQRPRGAPGGKEVAKVWRRRPTSVLGYRGEVLDLAFFGAPRR